MWQKSQENVVVIKADLLKHIDNERDLKHYFERPFSQKGHSRNGK